MEAVNINAEILMGATFVNVIEGSSQMATEGHAQVTFDIELTASKDYDELQIKQPTRIVFKLQ